MTSSQLHSDRKHPLSHDEHATSFHGDQWQITPTGQLASDCNGLLRYLVLDDDVIRSGHTPQWGQRVLLW
jgi:hypothetical protein